MYLQYILPLPQVNSVNAVTTRANKWLAIKRHYMKSLGVDVTDAAWQPVGVTHEEKQTQTVNSELVFRHGERKSLFFSATGQSRQSRLHTQAHKAFCVARKEHLLNLKCLGLAYFHPPLGSW